MTAPSPSVKEASVVTRVFSMYSLVWWPDGQQDVIVGVVGAGALEDLEMDLLAYLGVHLAVGLSRRRGHRAQFQG